MAERFCGAGIPLAFFKGTLLRSFYPEPHLCTMSDIDCLVSGENRKQAHNLMLEMGYMCDSDNGDVWVTAEEEFPWKCIPGLRRTHFRMDLITRTFSLMR